MTCVSMFFDSHRFTSCSSFWVFNPFEYLPVHFVLVFWLATLAFMFLAIYLLGELIFFVFSSQLFLHFVEILCFDFYLVNFECSAYLSVDHSSVHSYPKYFYYFFRLILSLILVLKPPFSIHISVSFLFCLLLLDLVVELEVCHQLYPSCNSCLFIFDSQLMLIHTN